MAEGSFLDGLITRHPALDACRADIEAAVGLISDCYRKSGKLLVCGNGGSAADADHIVGELMKGFLKKRALPEPLREKLCRADPEIGPAMSAMLQGALPAINLSASSALATAFANDVSSELTFAQLVLGYGRSGDVLLALSTSGKARNVLAALSAARAAGLATIGLTGSSGGAMKGRCDLLIRAPATDTAEVQELHLPIYHCLCAMIEDRFFP